MAVLFQKNMGQWLLRANFGVTKRANSVWTSADTPEGDFQQEAEHFYKGLGLPVCFHISNASPKGLDAVYCLDDHFIQLEEFSTERHQGYTNIFERMPPCKTFFTMYDQGSLAAVGTASVIDGYGGLSNIVVAKEHRGKGAGTQVIRTLTEWAIGNGAKHMYLQVLKENMAAVSLYEKNGFSPISEQHYRINR
ncbi:Putative acetyltransferase [Bacillus spizizenii]|nr:acetyltransferase domain protein [Bacillus spizizenii]SPU05483.1 acetyltransferase [Bacillus spizizenii]